MMRSIKASLIAASTAFAAIPAAADITRIENYLVGEEGERLAHEISMLRMAIQSDIRDHGGLRGFVGRCPASELPISTETLLLLTSYNPEDRAQFLAEYGEHIGLGKAYDPLNPYHRVVALASVNLDAPLVSRGDLSAEQLDTIATAFMEITSVAIDRRSDFWPPELNDLTAENLISIDNYVEDAELREFVSDILMPRALLTREMLLDQLRVCEVDADHNAASSRAMSYFDPTQ